MDGIIILEKKLLKQKIKNKEKMQTLNQLSSLYSNRSLEKALGFVENALISAEKKE